MLYLHDNVFLMNPLRTPCKRGEDLNTNQSREGQKELNTEERKQYRHIVLSNEALYDNVYTNMRQRVLYTYFFLYIIVTAIETTIVILNAWGMEGFNIDFVALHLLFPAGADAVLIIVTMVAIISKRLSGTVKNVILITCMSMICTVLYIAHASFPVFAVLMAAPILITSAFMSKRLTLYALGLSTILLAVAVFVSKWFNPMIAELKDRLINAAVLLCILIAETVVICIIDDLHKQREALLSQTTKENELLANKVRIDGLTGLYNHTSFYADLEAVLGDPGLFDNRHAVAVMDVDGFKQINDSFGHGMGDVILREAAELIKETVGRKGSCYRYGGDEFTVIFKDCSVESAANILSRILSNTSRMQARLPHGTELNVTLSAGLSEVGQDATSESVFSEADNALRMAKQAGKNRYVVFTAPAKN